MRNLLGLLVFVAVSGCGTDPCEGVGGACINLTVKGSGTVDTLDVTLSGAFTGHRVVPRIAREASLPVHLAVALSPEPSEAGSGVDTGGPVPKSVSSFRGGEVRLLIQAWHLGRSLGTGMAEVTLGAKEHGYATIHLDEDGSLDGGMGDAWATPDASCNPEKVDSDPNHCGACGHSCLGGSCVQGACQPFVLAASSSLQSQGNAVAVLGGSVYWASKSSTEMNPPWIVWRLPLGGGGAPSGIVTVTTSVDLTLAADASYLYWTNPSESLILRGGADGHGEALVEGAGHTVVLAVDAGHLYWAGVSALVTSIKRVPLSGAAEPEEILGNRSTILGLASDGTHLYWSEQVAAASSVFVMDLAQGSESVEEKLTEAAAVGVAVDESSVFWAAPEAGEVRVADKITSVRGTIAKGQGQPRAVAVDAVSVYWTTVSDNALRLMQVAR